MQTLGEICWKPASSQLYGECPFAIEDNEVNTQREAKLGDGKRAEMGVISFKSQLGMKPRLLLDSPVL